MEKVLRKWLSPARRPINTKSPYTVLVNQTTQHRGIYERKNLTELVFILDQTAPCRGLEGGHHRRLQRHDRKAEEGARRGLRLHRSLRRPDRGAPRPGSRLEKVRPITEKRSTMSGGCTALLDAIGGAIHHIGNIHKYARPRGCAGAHLSSSPPTAWRTPAAAIPPQGSRR